MRGLQDKMHGFWESSKQMATTDPTPTSSNITTPPPPQIMSPSGTPSGFTQTKTPGGGTGYSDAQGNIYAQTAVGVYSLIPATANPVSPVVPTTPTPTPTPSAPPAPTTPPATPPPTPATPQTTPGTYYFTRDANNQITYYDSNGSVLPTNPLGGDQFKLNPEADPNYSNGKLVKLNPNLLPSNFPGATSQTGATGIADLNAELVGGTADYAAKLDALNSQTDTAYNDYQTKLAQITNGTFPLTPTQSAILSATQQQFDILRSQQIIANQTYQQGLQVYEARSGEAQGGTTTAMGNVKNAIDQGIAKLNALDTQASITLANLQQGFQQNNLKMIQASYDAWNTYVAHKENALKEIQNATTQAVKDLRDFTYKTLQDNITNTLNSDKFTYQQKQDQIKNGIDQANLEINQKKEVLAEAQFELQKQLTTLFNQAISNAPQKNAVTGTVTPADQQKFLDQFPPEIQSNIKAVANYQAPLSLFPQKPYRGQTMPTQADMLAAASTYTGQDFNVMNYSIRQKFMGNWTSGGMAAIRSSANAYIQHLGELITAGNNLSNGDIQALNSAKNWAKEQTGSGTITAFQLAANAVADEYAKMLVTNLGSVQGATEQDRQNILNSIKVNLSPDQIKAVGNTTGDLMRDRLNTVYDIYSSTMGKPPSDILLPTTIAKLDNLKNLGVNTDFSGLLPQNSYNNASPEDLMNMGTSSGTSTTPQDNATLLQGIMNMFQTLQPTP